MIAIRTTEVSGVTERRREQPEDWSVREAVRRYLRRREPDSTQKSIGAWEYRLKLFVEWTESVGIETVGQLQPYDVDEYYELRASEVAPATLEGQMWTLSEFAEFLEDLGAVGDGLSNAVQIPDLDPEDRVDDTKLATDDAISQLQFYRRHEDRFGTRAHVLLELAWFTGARQGGLRALDVRDVELDDDPYVEFRHRPGETPLKNKMDGYRPVALREETADAIRTYLSEHRHDVSDEHGRQPLLASANGRPTSNTLRVWMYLATQPCLRAPCPHGEERQACQYTQYNHASKCPSSRSPHQVRTGAITWMLNRGWPPEDVAERVNASPKTIKRHYDHADPEERRRRLRERMEKRRRPLLEELDLDL